MGDRATIFFIVTVLVLLTVILIAAMKYFSAWRVGRLQGVEKDEWRELSRRAVQAQERGVAALITLETSVTDIQTRLSRVEGILKDVQ